MTHGINEAYYRVEEGIMIATLQCLCGEICEGNTWQEAGWSLDGHLDDNSPPRDQAPPASPSVLNPP